MEFDQYIDKLYSCSQWCRDISPNLAVENHNNIVKYKSQEFLKNFSSEINFYIIDNPTIENRFHFFPSNTDSNKLVIYFHGGCWQLLNLDSSVFWAKFFIENNYNFASIGYNLCPSVTLRDIVYEVRKGLKVLMNRYNNINEIYLSGHSAGAHLALMCAIYDGYDSELLLSNEEKNKLKGLILLSGIYDIRPFCQTNDNINLKLSIEEAWQLSPIRLIKNLDTFGNDFLVLIFTAEYDSPAFIDQSMRLHELSKIMQKKQILIFVFLTTILLISGEKYLKFVPSTFVQNHNNDFIMDNEDLSLDGFTTQQILVKVVKDKSFNFYCQIEELEHQFQLINAELCWKFDLKQQENCIKINKQKQLVKLMRNEFVIQYNNQTGFIASKTLGDLHGYYFCKLENQFDMIISNYIEFHNINYYKSIIPESFIPNIDIDNQPIRSISDSHIFEFGINVADDYKRIPRWISAVIEDSIHWRICPVSYDDYSYTWADCFKNEIQLIRNRDYYQFANFSIHLFEHVYEFHDKFVLESFNIIENTPLNKYKIKGKSTTNKQSLDKISVYVPESNEYQFREGDHSYYKNKLSAVYKGQIEKYSWSRLLLPLKSDFQQTERDLIFPSPITREHEGIYILTLTGIDKKSIKIDFKVSIISLPKIAIDYQIPQIIYKLPNQNALVETRIEGNNLRINFTINNFLMNYLNKKSKENSIQQLMDEFSYLKNINFQYSIDSNSYYSNIDIKLINLQKLLEIRGQFIILGFVIENSIGILRLRISINVVEYPIYRRTVDQVDCSNVCLGNRDYLFMCKIFDEDFIKKKFQIFYKWKINGEQVYFSNHALVNNKYLNATMGSLILKKHQDKYSKNIKIECRVIIKTPKDVINNKEIYDSQYDSKMSRNLQKLFDIIPAKKLENESIELPIMLISSVLFSFLTGTIIILCVLFYKTPAKCTNLHELEEATGLNPHREMCEEDELNPCETEIYIPIGKLKIRKRREPFQHDQPPLAHINETSNI